MNKIFEIKNDTEFNALALKIFFLQAEKNVVYKNFLKQLKIQPKSTSDIKDIHFLPIEFFKKHRIEDRRRKAEDGTQNDGLRHFVRRRQKLFLSSGTTGTNRSRHYVSDISLYEKSFTKCFELFYGNIEDYCLIGLLPSYMENKNSSLIYMTNHLIKKTKNKDSGFYLNNYEKLSKKLELLEGRKQKTILIGVSYALLDFAEKFPIKLKHTIIMETGGMKGRPRFLSGSGHGGGEMIREELHHRLCNAFGIKNIYSEYGMTELLSQAYSGGKGIFHCPPWMKIIIRDTNDPFKIMENGLAGGINVIDLANINSCSFIATQDLGKLYSDGSFEVLGRFDNSDVRGCNLLVG